MSEGGGGFGCGGKFGEVEGGGEEDGDGVDAADQWGSGG